MRASIIQPNINPSYKYGKDNIDDIKNILYSMSNNSDKSDLIIYPETVIPELYKKGKYLYKILSGNQNILISGIFRYDLDSNKTFNSMLIIENRELFYDKIKLVPFENLPFTRIVYSSCSFFEYTNVKLSRGNTNQREIMLKIL